jgi:hypothetical protein
MLILQSLVVSPDTLNLDTRFQGYSAYAINAFVAAQQTTIHDYNGILHAITES